MRLDDVLQLERRVWQALVEGDQDLDQSMLAEDFLGVYPAGFSDRAGHVDQLAAGPTVADYSLSEARLFVISDHDVLLSYRADWRRTVKKSSESSPSEAGLGETGRSEAGPSESMYVSSLWSRRDERWVNTFSQDTPTDPR